MKLDILFVGHDATVTGAPYFLLNLAQWIIKENDLKCHILLRNGGDLYNDYQQLCTTYLWNENTRTPVTRLIMEKLKLSKPNRLRKRALIIKQIQALKPSVIFCNTSTNGEILNELHEIGSPIIVRIPELETAIHEYAGLKSANQTFSLSSKIIAVSKAVRKNLVENFHVDPEKITVCYGSIPNRELEFTDANESFIDFEENQLIVGGIGTLNWTKGSDLFLTIAKLFYKKYPDSKVRFVWLGSTSNSIEKIKALYDIRKAGLLNRIKILDRRKDPQSVYKYFNIFLMCSREDSFPLVNIEIGSLGIPVLGFSNSGGTEELLKKVSSELLVDYLDVSEMADRIHYLIDHHEMRTNFGRRLQEVIREDFSFERSFTLILDEIFKVMEKDL
jgi:glycosyltransferase involved in cell wall biosynthesis